MSPAFSLRGLPTLIQRHCRFTTSPNIMSSSRTVEGSRTVIVSKRIRQSNCARRKRWPSSPHLPIQVVLPRRARCNRCMEGASAQAMRRRHLWRRWLRPEPRRLLHRVSCSLLHDPKGKYGVCRINHSAFIQLSRRERVRAVNLYHTNSSQYLGSEFRYQTQIKVYV